MHDEMESGGHGLGSCSYGRIPIFSGKRGRLAEGGSRSRGGGWGHPAARPGLLGADSGCVTGHHEANKRASQQATQNQGSSASSTGNGGQSNTGHKRLRL